MLLLTDPVNQTISLQFYLFVFHAPELYSFLVSVALFVLYMYFVFLLYQ